MSAPDSSRSAGSVVLGGRTIRRLGLGTNRVTDSPVARAFLRHAFVAGIDFVDTADVYTAGASESTIGQVIGEIGAAPMVATKGGMIRTESGYGVDGRPEHLREAVDASLRRLGRDRIDLYLLHRVDPRVPIEESVGALAELQSKGLLGEIGVSNVSLAELERARHAARIVCVENQYNVLERDHEEVLRFCEEHGLVFLPWTPFLRGKLALSGPLGEVARAKGATLHQVALAWLLARSPCILPIPGTLSETHLRENLAAGELALEAEDLRALDRASAEFRPPGA